MERRRLLVEDEERSAVSKSVGMKMVAERGMPTWSSTAKRKSERNR